MNQLKTCFGITSRTKDNLHVVFIDVDIPLWCHNTFEYILKQIQNDYHLSDFYILQSKNGFNAFTLDKIELELLYNILCEYAMIDYEFAYLGFNRKHYTLRMGNEKQYMRTVVSQYLNFYEKSYAHYLFFNDVMSYPISYNPYTDKFDDNEIIEICAYRSSKHGYNIGI